MSPTSNDLASQATALREEVAGLRRRVAVLAEQARYEDLEHALLGLRIVDHALSETAAGSGLGGEIHRTPDPTLHARATDLATRLEQLRADAAAFGSEHPNDDLDIAIAALEIAGGSLDEVVEGYEEGA